MAVCAGCWACGVGGLPACLGSVGVGDEPGAEFLPLPGQRFRQRQDGRLDYSGRCLGACL